MYTGFQVVIIALGTGFTVGIPLALLLLWAVKTGGRREKH
jgi:hypothetical protein